MPLSRRYSPEHPPGEACAFGLDFSPIIPVGVGLSAGAVSIQTNTAAPTDASADWQIGDVEVRGRALYAMLSGGVAGVDYQILWTAVDSQGNKWPRTTLVLCGATS